MSDTKTFVFGNEGANGNLLASILPSLQQRGIDTGYLMGMLGNNSNSGLFGGRGFEDIIALIIVAAIFGNGNFGFGKIFSGNCLLHYGCGISHSIAEVDKSVVGNAAADLAEKVQRLF